LTKAATLPTLATEAAFNLEVDLNFFFGLNF